MMASLFLKRCYLDHDVMYFHSQVIAKNEALLKRGHWGASMEKIIVFRPGALGDTLLAFPALAALRRAFPGAWLGAVGNAPALALARAAGLADEAMPFDLPCWAELFAEEGMRSVEARQMLNGAKLAVVWLRDPDGLAARNLRASGISLVASAPGRPPEGVRVHAADYLLATLAPVIGDLALAPASMPALTPSAEDCAWAETEWARRGLLDAPGLVLHPGSGGRAKCWPPERFAALAGRFIAAGWRVLVIEGPADSLAALQTLALLPTDAAQSAAGLPPLPDAGQLLKTEGVPLIATASANLVVNRAYEVDSAAGALTLTLPSAPVPGAYVWLTDVGGCVSRNNVTVTRNGSLINGVAEDFVMDVDRRNHLLVFINATYGWIIK